MIMIEPFLFLLFIHYALKIKTDSVKAYQVNLVFLPLRFSYYNIESLT